MDTLLHRIGIFDSDYCDECFYQKLIDLYEHQDARVIINSSGEYCIPDYGAAYECKRAVVPLTKCLLLPEGNLCVDHLRELADELDQEPQLSQPTVDTVKK